MFDTFQQFGFEPSKFFVQLAIFIVAVWLAIRATIRAIQAYTGIEVPLWILISWLIPIIGPITTLLVIRSRRANVVS